MNETLNFELREKLIQLALLQYQKRYEHGKTGPDTFDCAGLVWYLYYSIFVINIFRNSGYGLSTTTKIMTCNYGRLLVYKENIRKDLCLIRNGDILFFHRQSISDNEPKIDNKYPGHCGIYLGNENFIHASRVKEKVIISNFNNNPYWNDVLVGSKDIISDESLKIK